MKSIQEIKWKPIFTETQGKACDFEAKGFLNNYVFFAPDTEFPPTLDQILKYAAPTQKLKKKFPKEKLKWKVKKVCPQPYIYMVHCTPGSSQKRKPTKWQVPFQGRKFEKSQNWNWNSQNHKPNTGTETGKHKGEESYKNWRDQPTNNTTKLPSMQPTNSKLELEFTKP